jgi:predicted enzyme related to lactoylglutathione lyase
MAEDYEAALTFYRDVLGMPEQESYQADGGALVTILDAGRATLELANPAQVAYIDKVEVGHPASRGIRVALEVGDVRGLTQAAVGAGATLLAPPTRTPWESLNARLEGPAGLQLTLFGEREEQVPAPD